MNHVVSSKLHPTRKRRKLTDVYCSPKGGLRSLEPVLQKWTKLNRKLADAWRGTDGDVPWWYNERAVLSTFAGAVWLEKGTVLEEYSSYKGPQSKDGKRKEAKRTRGRVDIFFTIGRWWFIGEAKQCWPDVFKDELDMAKIENCIREAIQAVRRSRPEKMRRLALAFVVPNPKKGLTADLRSCLGRLVSKVKRLKNIDAAAWVFPDTKDAPEHKGKIYPGIILLVKEVRIKGK